MLVGDRVPDDERWDNFLVLMEIVDHLFCPQVTEDQAAYVAALISDHHQDFCELYPDHSIIPKMHFMVHMPRLMIQCRFVHQLASSSCVTLYTAHQPDGPCVHKDHQADEHYIE